MKKLKEPCDTNDRSLWEAARTDELKPGNKCICLCAHCRRQAPKESEIIHSLQCCFRNHKKNLTITPGQLKTPDQLYPIKVSLIGLQPCKSVILNVDRLQSFPFTIFFLQDGARIRKVAVRHMDQAIALMSAWCTSGELLKPLNHSTTRDGSAWRQRNAG